MPISPVVMRIRCRPGFRVASAASPPSRRTSHSSTGTAKRFRPSTTSASGSPSRTAFTQAPATENSAAATTISRMARRRAAAGDKGRLGCMDAAPPEG